LIPGRLTPPFLLPPRQPRKQPCPSLFPAPQNGRKPLIRFGFHHPLLPHRKITIQAWHALFLARFFPIASKARPAERRTFYDKHVRRRNVGNLVRFPFPFQQTPAQRAGRAKPRASAEGRCPGLQDNLLISGLKGRERASGRVTGNLGPGGSLPSGGPSGRGNPWGFL
jgi:hypothetical protein